MKHRCPKCDADLHTTKYGALPVLRDGRLCGMLTDTDLIHSLTELLQGG